METRGLLFIPDISGFTKFVNQTDIEHSRLIIQELLEILINANHIGLEVSEVEGDAILFYKFGDSPNLEELYKQVHSMFCEFHRHLIAYDMRKYCQCKACRSAIDLSLKVITHFGEFTQYNVKNFHKLIGKDVIVAHQLLKNDIEKHEYWLITDNLLKDGPPKGPEQWMNWEASFRHTESGDINYHYTQLTKLREAIPQETPGRPQLQGKVKVISVSREYDTDIISLFHAVGDFSYRHRWQDGVKRVEEMGHFLPRVGMRCRCILDNGETHIYSASYSFSPELIEFSETDEEKKTVTYYTLESLGPEKTRFTYDLYFEKNIVNELIFRFFRKKEMEASFRRSLLNLVDLSKEIKRPYVES